MRALVVEGQTLDDTVQIELKQCNEQYGPNLIKSLFLLDSTKTRECNVSETIYPNAYKKLDENYDIKTIVTDKAFRDSLGSHNNSGIDLSIEGSQINVSVKTNLSEKNGRSTLAPRLRGYTTLQGE